MPETKVLVIAGAGTSVELGVPSMAGLADEFLQHAQEWSVQPDLVARVLNGRRDIECLIEEIDQVCSASGPLRSFQAEPMDLSPFATVRAEIEWFIQHAAERITAKSAHLMWGAVLQRANRAKLTIVTTNYDRAIELAGNTERITIDDGFTSFSTAERATWAGFGQSAGILRLIKLHGSTDWFADDKGAPVKLRHPMPLFGNALLRLSDGTQLGSALIFPSREKRLSAPPYPRLLQAFLNAADDAELVVAVGSSLRDEHLRSAANDIARQRPLFVVNPFGDNCGVAGANVIKRTASAFLLGSLPSALASDNPAAALMVQASSDTPIGSNSLEHLATALRGDAALSDRCRAIEMLDNEGVGVDSPWIDQLLSAEKAEIARYALALVSHIPNRQEALKLAESVSHAGTDHAYLKDLEMLRSLVLETGT